MILVRNKLKRLKKTIEDDDMLNYLKYSHLDMSHKNINKSFEDKSFEDKSTQFPETQNKSTQTKDTADKGVDTYDDLNVIIGDYILDGLSKNFDRNEKMVQVNALKRNNSNSPPSSSSGDDGESLTSKSIKMGFRLAGLALQTAITGANSAMTIGNTAMNVGDVISDLISAPHQSSEEEQVNNTEVISVHSSPPQTINSSSSDVEEVPIEISSSSSSRQTQTTIPQPTSPQSTPASSAKTTPRKKSK